MAEPDFLDRLQAGRDALAKFQQSMMRLAMPADQRKALFEGMSNLVMPGEQLQTIVDLMDAFGPPLAQIEALQAELAEQRTQVEAMNERLAHIERAAERLALASEQLVMFQEPFVRMTEAFTGQPVTRVQRSAPNPDNANDEES